MNHSLAAISSAVSACVAQLLKFFAKWQPIALVYFALHGFLRLKCHLQFSYGTVQYLRQQWPLRSCTLARCVIFLCNLNQQLWRSQFPQPKKLLRGEGEGCQRACHVCFSTAVLHETHETAASQWMCGAPARDVGKAKSYQSMCRILGATEVTYFRWRKEYGGMKADQAKRFKRIEQENLRLKRLLAEAELDKAILREAA